MSRTQQHRLTDGWLGPLLGRAQNTHAVGGLACVQPKPRAQRRGMALLLCLFVLSIVTVWLVDMIDSQTVNESALRNMIEYEQSLYLSNAGVHHAVAELEANTSWRGTATAGSYPASGSYSATAVDGGVAGTVTITSYGVSGQVTRKLQATVQLN